MKLNIGRTVPVLVICAVCVFGAVGCKKVAKETAENPKARKFIQEGGELVLNKLKEEGLKEAGKEGLKYLEKKYNESQNKGNHQPASPYPNDMGKRPLTDEEKRINQQLYRNWQALQSANSNQQSSTKSSK